MRKYVKIFIRWFRMVSGRSVFHKTQKIGLFWKKDSIGGYYSDLRHKVTKNNKLDSLGIPVNITGESEQIYFPITIFQYGLGAFDLYLETHDNQYKEKFFDVVKWCVENQMENGAWDAFGWCNKKPTFSSMAQAEGASLLCRAFAETKDKKYLESARNAIDYMLLPIEDGGTACYDNLGKLVTLEEKMDAKTVMNGMIFSIWGLYDYLLCVPDSNYKEKMLQAVDSLANLMQKFDRGYWSNYDLEGHIASPFYHQLHIEQLKVMAELFENEEFEKYQIIFKRYNNSWVNRKIAFVVKAIQKIRRINKEAVLVE